MDPKSDQPIDYASPRAQARRGRLILLVMALLIVLAAAIYWMTGSDSMQPAPEPADTGSIDPSGVPSGNPRPDGSSPVNPPTPRDDKQP